MNLPDKRIKKLQIKINDPDALHRNVTVLEDAFNMISIPGLPPNSLVIVRRFEIGYLQGTSSSILSHLISERIRPLTTQAACADQEEQVNAPIVWFSDSTQPYISLAHLIAQGKKPAAWYWPCILPQARERADSRKLLRSLIFKAYSACDPGAALGRIVESFFKANEIDKLLQIMTPEFARQFLKSANITFEDPETERQHFPKFVLAAETIKPEWIRPIRKWIGIWGAEDPRTVWLVYNAVLLKIPSFTEISNPIHIIKQTIHAIRNPELEIKPIPSKKQRRRSIALSPPTVSQTEKKIVSESLTHSRPNYFYSNPEIDDDPFLASENKNILQEKHVLYNSSPGFFKPLAPLNNKLSEGGKKLADIKLTSPEAEENLTPSIRISRGTEFSGLLFIIPLLEQMGIREILHSHPELVLINLPEILFWATIHRLKIPKEDPVCGFLANENATQDIPIHAFSAPSKWKPWLFYDSDKERIIHKHCFNPPNNGIAYTDPKSRFLLAYSSEGDSSTLPAWCSPSKIIEVKRNQSFSLTTKHFASALQRLLAKILTRFTGMGIRALVQRRGHISLTKTHVDILFKSKDADIRIRRAGIDIDPGWVSWLGKVVQYHYGDEEN